jgi:hypothetical protein
MSFVGCEQLVILRGLQVCILANSCVYEAAECEQELINRI